MIKTQNSYEEDWLIAITTASGALSGRGDYKESSRICGCNKLMTAKINLTLLC
jgi:hypothetical protein